MDALLQIGRLAAVIGLIIAAALLATPKGRAPLALRGLLRILRKDAGLTGPVEAGPASVSKRLLAFVLVLLAALLALV